MDVMETWDWVAWAGHDHKARAGRLEPRSGNFLNLRLEFVIFSLFLLLVLLFGLQGRTGLRPVLFAVCKNQKGPILKNPQISGRLKKKW